MVKLDFPAIVRFEGMLASEPKTGKVYLEIPENIRQKLTGMTRLEGAINGQPFRAPLAANRLSINQIMLRGSGAKIGDSVQLVILGPEPKPLAPSDLAKELSKSSNAQVNWQNLSADIQRDWIRWIILSKQAETRTRRIKRTIEQLEEGKRRPCCVNFYEFMNLAFVHEEKKVPVKAPKTSHLTSKLQTD